MNQAPSTAANPFGTPLTATAADLASQASHALATGKAALIQDFPLDPDRYIEFLNALGEPLENYGAGAGNTAYALHPNINVVRCVRQEAAGARVQEQGGPLPAHSARAFSAARPRYIAMLMADPGWPAPPGAAGESVVVAWRDALDHMRNTDPSGYSDDYAILSQTPVTITAQYVTGQWATTPLIYPLADRRDSGDIGVRYSLALTAQLPQMAMEPGLRDRYQAALTRFAQAASDPAVRFAYRMRAGEIIILDNNRYGHGRLTFPRTRPGTSGDVEVNPRELWSVVIA